MEKKLKNIFKEELRLENLYINSNDFNEISKAIPEYTQSLGYIFDKIIENQYSIFPIGNKTDQISKYPPFSLIYLESQSETLIFCIFFIEEFSNIRISERTIKELIKLREITNLKIFLVFSKKILKKQPFEEELGLFINYVNLEKININSIQKSVDYDQKFYWMDELLKPGFPIGKISRENKLNDLSGREWLKFSKTWFIHNPPPRKKEELLHPAKFPETLIEMFIDFFTKRNDLILDPFLGTGSTMVAAYIKKRSCIGIELMPKYADIAKRRINLLIKKDATEKLDKFLPNYEKKNKYNIFTDDSRNIVKIWKENELEEASFCITSPPYWNQLKQNSMRQKERKEFGLDTIYSENESDIGNIDDYNLFLEEQKKIFDQVYGLLKSNGYLVIITNNIFFKGRLYPLAFDTTISLSDKWVPKDEKIWCQDDKALLALGVNSAWVGNRHHQYCLIFRKESQKK